MGNKDKRNKRAKLKAKQARVAKQKSRSTVSNKAVSTDSSLPSLDAFKSSLEARLAKRLMETTFEELTVGGSKLRFEMALAIDGYPFELPDGANADDYCSLLTNDQYMSGYYDEVINEVFWEAQASDNDSLDEDSSQVIEGDEPVYSTHCMACDHGENYLKGEEVPESCPVCSEHKDYNILDLIALHD